MLDHCALDFVSRRKLALSHRELARQQRDLLDLFMTRQPAVQCSLGQEGIILFAAEDGIIIEPLDDLDRLWNTRWSDGGYDRYHTSGQPDQPGPWPFATTFILRAEHDAGNFGRSRRALEWLNTCQGGRAGTWFEEIPSTRTQAPFCGLVCWTSGEVALFVVRHYLGVNFEHGALTIRPALYPDSPPVRADLRYRQGRILLEVNGSGPIKSARVNAKRVDPSKDGILRLPPEFSGGTVVIEAGP